MENSSQISLMLHDILIRSEYVHRLNCEWFADQMADFDSAKCASFENLKVINFVAN